MSLNLHNIQVEEDDLAEVEREVDATFKDEEVAEDQIEEVENEEQNGGEKRAKRCMNAFMQVEQLHEECGACSYKFLFLFCFGCCIDIYFVFFFFWIL